MFAHWVTGKWKLANQMGHSASLRLLYLDANDYVLELAGVWGVRSLSFCLKLYLDFKEFSEFSVDRDMTVHLPSS